MRGVCVVAAGLLIGLGWGAALVIGSEATRAAVHVIRELGSRWRVGRPMKSDLPPGPTWDEALRATHEALDLYEKLSQEEATDAE